MVMYPSLQDVLALPFFRKKTLQRTLSLIFFIAVWNSKHQKVYQKTPEKREVQGDLTILGMQ